MIKHFFIFLLVYSSSNVFSQNKIVDLSTKKALPYNYIKLINQTKGTIADYNGEFILDSTYNVFDTLIVSCIGYESKVITIKNIQKHPIIELKGNTKLLKEVVITSKKIKYQRKKIGVLKNPKKKFFEYTVTTQNVVERATWIPNKYAISGRLNSVNIYIKSMGLQKAHFRIHIYQCSSYKSIPGKELTNQVLFLQAKGIMNG